MEWIITKVVEEFNSLDIAYIARQEDATTTLAVFVQAVDLFDSKYINDALILANMDRISEHIEPGRTLFIKFRNESGFSFRIANGQRWACNGRLTLDELTSHLGEF